MNYFYEAHDGSGQTVLGKIDAPTEAEARRILVERGFRPQSLAANPAPQGAGIGDTITMMGSLQGMQLAARIPEPKQGWLPEAPPLVAVRCGRSLWRALRPVLERCSRYIQFNHA